MFKEIVKSLSLSHFSQQMMPKVFSIMPGSKYLKFLAEKIDGKDIIIGILT